MFESCVLTLGEGKWLGLALNRGFTAVVNSICVIQVNWLLIKEINKLETYPEDKEASPITTPGQCINIPKEGIAPKIENINPYFAADFPSILSFCER